jgi:serine/threonine protein phosphatase 1
VVNESTAIIGDVHGDVLKLEAMLRLVSGRNLVFVGDLINRGPHSRAVMELVSGLVAERRAVVVRGNHEVALLSYWRGHMSFVDFALMGGLPTLKSYLPQVHGDVWSAFRFDFPEQHRVLLETAVDEHWVGAALVKHWDPAAETALVTRDGSIARGKPLVVGHTVVGSAERVGDVVFLDSGCGVGGPLSALLWPEETFISTDVGAPYAVEPP